MIGLLFRAGTVLLLASSFFIAMPASAADLYAWQAYFQTHTNRGQPTDTVTTKFLRSATTFTSQQACQTNLQNQVTFNQTIDEVQGVPCSCSLPVINQGPDACPAFYNQAVAAQQNTVNATGNNTNTTNTGNTTQTNTSGNPTQTNTTGSHDFINTTGDNGGTGIINPLGTCTGSNCLENFLMSILAFIIRLGTIVIVLMLVYIGFLFATTSVNPENKEKARGALLWTLVGALILLGAQAIALGIKETVDAFSVGN